MTGDLPPAQDCPDCWDVAFSEIRKVIERKGYKVELMSDASKDNLDRGMARMIRKGRARCALHPAVAWQPAKDPGAPGPARRRRGRARGPVGPSVGSS